MTVPIDFTQSAQYNLSIRLSTDGFSFSVFNPQDNRECFYSFYPVNARHSMAANLKQFLAEAEEIKHQYKQVNILVHTERYTSVPLEWYEDELTDTLFYQNLPRRNNEVILCNVLGKSNVVILFALDKLSHLFLTEHFPEARFFATISPLTEYFCQQSKGSERRRLLVHLQPETVDVIAFGKDCLQLVNTYSVSSTEDCCYYLLGIWKQLGYDQEHDELHVCGEPAAERTEVLECLKKYVRHVIIINPRMENSIPFDMQSLILCE